MNNFIKFFLVLFLVTSCSSDKSSKFWSKGKKIFSSEGPKTCSAGIFSIKRVSCDSKKLSKNLSASKDLEVEDKKEIFAKEEALNNEFNPNLKLEIYSKAINNNSLETLNNNDGRVSYNGKLENISKYKFKKIENFDQYEYEITSNQNNIIFFDNKGSILNFDNKSNLVWNKNYYSKSEKKQKPKLFFSHNKKILIVADNIAKLYALDIKTGELIWKTKTNAPHNSQIKIYKNKFYIIDFENTLRAYSVNDGKEIWNNKTQKSLIRSQKKLSLVIKDEIVYFNNSLGDISAVDINSGNLIWQTPTQSSIAYDVGFFLKTSVIVMDNNALFFSNNQNQFFSIDTQTGTINWKQEINSSLRPTIINDLIFTVSDEGYLIILEKKTGNIIRVNDTFGGLKKNFFSSKGPKTCAVSLFSTKRVPCNEKKIRTMIKPTGFIVGTEKIYISTDNGRLLVVEISNGKVLSELKIDNKKISRPSIINKNLYVITENSIIKLN